MHEDIAERVLDLAQDRCSPLLAEVRVEERETRELAVRSGQMSSISRTSDSGMNVRIVMSSGIGFASVNRVSKTAAVELVRRAHKMAKSGRRKSQVMLSSEPAVRTSWEVREERRLKDVPSEEKLAFLKGLDSSAMSTGAKVQGRYYLVRDHEVGSYFANSEGSRIRSYLPRVVVEATLMVSSKGDSEQSYQEWAASGGWEKVEEMRLDQRVAAEVRTLKAMIDKGRRVKPGVYDLVCGPEVVGIAAHESCGHPMEADRILGREMSQAGRSFISQDMLGQKVGSEYATVVDDPAVPGSYGYYAYDQEGVRARPRVLYKDGVVNEFLHNRETAARMAVQSNGSSRSENYLREPIVRMANTYVPPGDFEEDEIFGSIREGIMMSSFTEWNIDDKRFNQKYVSREAYFIEDGELAGPARRCVLELTTPGFWGAVDAATKKVELFAGECGKGDPAQLMAVTNGGPMIRLRKVMLK